MRLNERLQAMREQRRELVGRLIKDEANRMGLISKRKQSEFFHYSEPSVHRLFHGNVPDARLRDAEGKLGLPAYFFAYVLEDDRAALEELDMGEKSDLRRRALAGLTAIARQVADVEINGSDR